MGHRAEEAETTLARYKFYKQFENETEFLWFVLEAVFRIWQSQKCKRSAFDKGYGLVIVLSTTI